MVSDSGTPGVSDPGYRLIRLCRQEGIPVLPVPGPSAAVAALSVSGLPTDAFYFVGFLPPKAGQRRRRLEDLRGIGATLVFYEAPHRVRGMLADLEAVLGDRTVSIAREMTKIHEEHLFGRLSEVRERVRPKGEFVVVVEGSGEPDRDAGDALDLEGLSRNELLKAIGERTGVGRKALYEALFRR
jgi:16S rRNA (cytidine1402-2'-O)-methyltransferase